MRGKGGGCDRIAAMTLQGGTRLQQHLRGRAGGRGEGGGDLLLLANDHRQCDGISHTMDVEKGAVVMSHARLY